MLALLPLKRQTKKGMGKEMVEGGEEMMQKMKVIEEMMMLFLLLKRQLRSEEVKEWVE